MTEGILHGKSQDAGRALPLPPKVKNKPSWSETRGKAPEERLRRNPDSWLQALSTVQALMHTHSRLLLGKKNWLESSLQYPHCPGQLALPLPSPRTKGLPHWTFSRLTCRDQNQCVWNCRTDHLEGPASGNKHHPGSSPHSPRSASEHW